MAGLQIAEGTKRNVWTEVVTNGNNLPLLAADEEPSTYEVVVAYLCQRNASWGEVIGESRPSDIFELIAPVSEEFGWVQAHLLRSGNQARMVNFLRQLQLVCPAAMNNALTRRMLPITLALKFIDTVEIEGDTENIDDPVDFISFLEDFNYLIAFPEMRVTWEGIAKILNMASRVAADSLVSGSKRFTEVIYWTLHFIARRPHPYYKDYPGVHLWILHHGWAEVNDLVQHIVTNLPPQPLLMPDQNEVCDCFATNGIRKDEFVDVRFPSFFCRECKMIWCRIEKCKETFRFPHQLLTHFRLCHKYPPSQEVYCLCGSTQFPRLNFQSSQWTCGTCNGHGCLTTGCKEIFDSQTCLRNHQTRKHPNPYVCQKCRIQQKPRGGVGPQIGSCLRCGNNFWCLRGYCTKELGTANGIFNHQQHHCTFPLV